MSDENDEINASRRKVQDVMSWVTTISSRCVGYQKIASLLENERTARIGLEGERRQL